MTEQGNRQGFTLIELSIVLVIIGLIVGGILVGQDMIKSAAVRAQITQIEKFNQAVHTFDAKYNALPGDMPPSIANQYGFTVGSGCTGTSLGLRDGNGLLDGGGSGYILEQGGGEVLLFWQDLSSYVAGSLIEGGYPNSGGGAIDCNSGCCTSISMSTAIGTTFVGDFLPASKLGRGAYTYVYETSGYNWYGLSNVSSVGAYGVMTSNAAISVTQAFRIDAKIDDGLPTTGAVVATYLNSGIVNAPNAASDTTSTCYNTTGPAYSVSSLANYGSGGNCALSFRFQ